MRLSLGRLLYERAIAPEICHRMLKLCLSAARDLMPCSSGGVS